MDHRTYRLLVIPRCKDFLPSAERTTGLHHKGAALECAAELAACHHLLAGVAAFLKVHPAHRLVVQHLRHKRFEHWLTQRGHAAAHLAPQPCVQGQGVALWRWYLHRCHPQLARRAVGRVELDYRFSI